MERFLVGFNIQFFLNSKEFMKNKITTHTRVQFDSVYKRFHGGGQWRGVGVEFLPTVVLGTGGYRFYSPPHYNDIEDVNGSVFDEGNDNRYGMDP